MIVTAVGTATGTCHAAPAVSCAIGTLTPGQTATVTVTYSSSGRHTTWPRDWSSDVCSSDLGPTDSNLATLTIIQDTALSVTKTFSPTTVTSGDGDHTFTDRKSVV